MKSTLSPKQFLSWLEGCLETHQGDNVVIPAEVLELRLQQFKAWIGINDMKSDLMDVALNTLSKLVEPYVKR